MLMTLVQTEYYRAAIVSLIEQLEESKRYLDGETQPIEPSVAIGRLSRMEALQEKSIQESMLRKGVARLEALRNALTRIDNGSYGVCLRCAQAIPIGRLEAIPEALVCVACMEKKR